MSREAFTTIRSEGGILPADLLSRVAALSPDLEAIGPEAYHLAANERLGEAITRSWNRLSGVWDGFKEALAAVPSGDPATSATRSRWLLLLFQELGYGQLQTAKAVELDNRSYAVSHSWGAVPIHLVGANVDLDRRSPGVAGAASATPHGLVQELLNRTDERLWGFVSNGRRLRVLRDNAALTRQAFVEFDLEAMFDGQQYADFAVLWLVCHESRVEGDVPDKFVLEQWMADAAQRGTRALDHLRDGVEEAIERLGAGFLSHAANSTLRDRLRSGELATDEYQRQLLRVVYRLLFLSVAEARELLLRPDAGGAAIERYRRFYSVDRLRSIAEVSRGGPHGDLWRGLTVVFGNLGSADGLPSLGLPALGSFLWSTDACPELDDSELTNRDLLTAIRALSQVRDGKVTRTVDYRSLGAEELGSIYESLLELHPDLDVDAKSFTLTTAAGHERKTTGSYYTPTSLVSELLDSALDPVIDEAAARDDPETAILALTVLDPACGSGHFLIAAAHRIARRLATVRSGEVEPAPLEVRTALRDVVGRCLYGIDINPMAVELCKVSLWMEAMEPGKPLSFLDHHIVCGNALLGTTPELLANGVPDGAFKALTGDDKEVVKAWRKRNHLERKNRGQLALDLSSSASPGWAIAREIDAIDSSSDATPGDLAQKEHRWRELLASTVYERTHLEADAWCSAFLARKVHGSPVLTDETVRALASATPSVDAAVRKVVADLAQEFALFHVHVAFPHIVGVDEGDSLAGFSAVVGNPPWERMRFEEREWFAPRAPDIASASGERRKRLIRDLEASEPALFADYVAAIRQSEAERLLITESGAYPLATGRLNTYAAFVELATRVVGVNGRVGLIVPSGIVTDDTTKDLFSSFVSTRRLVSVFDFVNDAGLFPGVGHGRQKFALVTISGSSSPDPAKFVFFASSTADLRDQERQIALTADDLSLLNPNTRTSPTFRSRRDARITKFIHEAVPVFRSKGEPPTWPVEPRMIIDMTGDSRHFRTPAPSNENWLVAGRLALDGSDALVPLFEAKMVHHFNHRWGDYAKLAVGSRDSELPRPSREELDDPTYLNGPRYWIPQNIVDTRVANDLTWMPVFRDICRSTDERTVIASIAPRSAIGNPLPALVPTTTSGAIALLPALLSSFVVDFVARQKVGGTHLNLFIFDQLPLLPRSVFRDAAAWSPSPLEPWLLSRVLELNFTAWDLCGLARDLGYDGPPFRWDAARRESLRAELDAAFFLLYDIERDDVDYIMETFPIVKRKDEKKHGEYRTKRLILEVYDAMAKAIESGEPYQTILDPPPADPSCAHPESTRPEWAK